MNVGYDLRILRYPRGGTRRYARELHRAMAASVPEGRSLVALAGWPKLDSASQAIPTPARRAINLAAEIGWLSLGASWGTLRHQLGAWFSPGPQIPFRLPRPIVAAIHDVNVLTHPWAYDPAYVRWATAQLHLATARADGLVVPSEFVRRQVIERFGVEPSRVTTAPEGVDHARIRTSARHGVPTPYALYVGQTEPHKNVGLLLDAWRSGVPDDLTLVVCGPAGRDEPQLRERAGALRRPDRIVFTGAVPEARLGALYAGARMFLFPSLAEGFGLPPVEAMAHGIPTAVADAGSLPEVTAGAALIFDPNDPEALALVVTRLAGDEALRADLRERGRTVASGYTWAASARQTWVEIGRAIRG
ncbi:MAG: hypothetical protein QOH61_100 [Chloroflexota bacterium]|nr:hypothetical protein [Chloroflexota bacterium]